MTSDHQNTEISTQDFRILVVEDSGLQAKVLVELLRSIGYSSITACPNAQSAFEHIQKEKFDLILCDWQMPKKSGLEFLKELRLLPEFQKLPFIFVTGQAEKAAVIEALRSGAQDYIVKPPNGELIKLKLDVFAKKKMAEEI